MVGYKMTTAQRYGAGNMISTAECHKEEGTRFVFFFRKLSDFNEILSSSHDPKCITAGCSSQIGHGWLTLCINQTANE